MKRYLTTSEAAKILGISTVAVFKRIKKGALPAEKIGHSYAIDPSALGLKSSAPSKKTKKRIKEAVKKVVDEYKEALKKLGNE